MHFSQYTVKETEEILELFSSEEGGLSEKEAKNRQKIYGLNEIKIKETGVLDVLFRQFKSPFFYLLFIAAAIALFVGEFINSIVIAGFVVVNVAIGFFQEARAVRTSSLLKEYISLEARVKREGKEKIIDRKFIVPGDIVLLEPGNVAPADLRLLKTNNFMVDEEALSGEAFPVAKDSRKLPQETKELFEAKNIVFAASSVIAGEAEGIVIGAGKNAVFGQIAKLSAEAKKESAYGKNILKFSRIILRTVIVSIVFIFLANLIFKGSANFLEFLIFCVALIVSIIPEALPAVITFALSQGALKMTKNKVVVKRLSAIEDLGDIEILCSDKTGTLTENKLTLDKIFAEDKEKCLLYGLLSSSFMKEEIESTQSSFDAALVKKLSPVIRKKLSEFKPSSEIPFDSSRLRTTVFLEDKQGKKILITKGAPEAVLNLCSKFGAADVSPIKAEIENEGKEGKRVLVIAYKELNSSDFSEKEETNLTFLGFFSFSDPLKKTAKSAVELSQKLGVKIKILTGDAPEVAGAVAKEIGLIKDSAEVVLGQNIENLKEGELDEICEKFNVFARVSPQTKYKIVKTLQKKFEVGFLGEGINDAPALKAANVAVAVREGADISREISDIILLKKDLGVLVEGIKQGRNIFSNINKYIKCTLASNFGNFYSIAAISLFIPYLPMLPIQILLVNFLSDFPLIAIATDRVDSEQLSKPKSYQLHQILWLIISLALVSTIFDFIFFGIFHKSEPSLLRTLWFIESILTEIFLIYSVRTRHFFLKTQKPSVPLMFFSALAIVLTVGLPFTDFGRNFFFFAAPPFEALLIVLFLIVSYLAVSETVKLGYFRAQRGNIVK